MTYNYTLYNKEHMTKSLINRIIKSAGKGSRATVLDQSDFFSKDVLCQTEVPIVNIMLGGSLDGGITPGITGLVGDSRTFKTNMCLLMVASYLKAFPEAICIFVDCEFGAARYFKTFGIDESRVIHIPIENIEEMKFQVVKMLDELTMEDKAIFFIDSVSQVASKREVDNALNDNAAADMSRAAQLNSFWRMITPKLVLRKMPMFYVNSFYESMESAWAEPIIKGGKQGFLSSDALWMTTRSQEKDDKTLKGWTFNYNAMKSRFVKEKSKFGVTVLFDGGIQKYSGMLDLARAGGFIDMPVNGWYQRTALCGITDPKKYRVAECDGDEFWTPIITNENFREFVKNRFSLENGFMFQETDAESGEIKQA